MANDETIARAIAGFAKVVFAPFLTRLAAVEQKLVELDARALGGPFYAGTFQQGESYKRGALVTRNGGLWLALRDTRETPGATPAAWRLVVKSGGA
jgi:hypothetical protein